MLKQIIALSAVKNQPQSVRRILNKNTRRRYAPQSKKPITLHKFGGSSVGSAQAIRDVAKIIANHEDSNVVAVVSAMYGVTDQMVKAMDHTVNGDIFEVLAVRDHIIKIHHNTVKNLFGERDQELQSEITIQIDHMITSTFAKMLTKMGKELSQKEKDSFIILGEKLTGVLVSNAVKHLSNRTCKAVNPQNVIHVDGEFGNGIPDLARTEANAKKDILPLFTNYSSLIVPGFFGGDKENNQITLGRGGSDLSASVLGYALNAKSVSLWKVECEKEKNVMTKWKKGCIGVVNSLSGPYNQTVPFLDYQTATEMFKLGKKVLHPRAVEPAKLKNIPILVKNTLEPEKEGTMIWNPAKERQNTKAIVVNPLETLVNNNEIALQYNQETIGKYEDGCSVVSIVGDHGEVPAESKSIYEKLLKANNIVHTFPEKIVGLQKTLAILVPKSKEDITKNLILKSIHN